MTELPVESRQLAFVLRTAGERVSRPGPWWSCQPWTLSTGWLPSLSLSSLQQSGDTICTTSGNVEDNAERTADILQNLEVLDSARHCDDDVPSVVASDALPDLSGSVGMSWFGGLFSLLLWSH